MEMYKNAPKISVITVVYNGVALIEETILSIIGQTYMPVEYIVVDGGSTDGTVDIIKKYEDKITFWISEPDKGIYDAMNKAVTKCTGEWVNFMNAGDGFFNDRVIEEVFRENREDASVIYGPVHCFDQYKKVVIQPDRLENLSNHMIFCHQSSFVRRKLLLENKFDLKYKIAADYNLFFNLYHQGYQFYETPVCIANYEVESGISSKNGYLGAKDNLQINKNWGHPKHMLIFYYRCMLFYTFYNLKRMLPHRLMKSILMAKYKKQMQ